jgi:branched-chain amino acid transport system substrate-binding protein
MRYHFSDDIFCVRSYMRKLSTLISSLLVVLVAITSVFTACSTAKLPASVKIGAFVGLTGSASVYGLSQQKGIQMAVDEINASNFLGEGTKLNVVFADAGSTSNSSVQALNDLLNQGVSGLIGPTLSAQALIADPLAQTAGIPLLAISNTAPGITEMGDFIFRVSLPESSVIDGTIKSASGDYNVKKVGILWGASEAFTVGGYNAFIAALSKYSVKILVDVSYQPGDTDFTSQLSQIIAVQPDAICVSALAKEAKLIIQQARDLGFTGTIIGGNGFNTTEIIQMAGAAAGGIMVGTAWDKNSAAQKNTDFITNYQKLYGVQPDQFAAQAYTAVWLFAQAIVSAQSADPKAIRDALAKISDFDTPLGKFSFTATREPVHPSTVQVMKNGVFVIAK